MALTQYCEHDEVRAALGVNSVELPSTVLNLPVYEIGLVRELAKVSASLPAAFSAISNLQPEARTVQQATVFDATRLFAVYAAAKQVGVSLSTLAPKDVSDGKASLARFSGTPYLDVLTRVEAMFAGCRADLSEAYAALTGQGLTDSLTLAGVFLAGKRAYDPVTGS